MQLIRALHILKYDPNRKRFQSDTFKNYKGGISVFEELCAKKTSGDICTHIKTYYGNFSNPPIIYCKFTSKELEASIGSISLNISNTPSDSGDSCHRDIKNVNDKDAQFFCKNHFKSPNIFVCCKGKEIQVTQNQYEDLSNFVQQC